MDADGDFIIAWTRAGAGASSDDIYARRYTAAGDAVGEEFRVNTTAANCQELPAVAMDAGGNFVIAWSSASQDGSLFGVYAQRYTAAGTAVGGEFQVNTFTAENQRSPAAAMDADGDFVVAWESYDQDGSRNEIYAQRYTAAGTATGAEFRVNTFTTSSQSSPAVAMDADGDFVVAWQSYGQDGSGLGVYAQRYAANQPPATLRIATVTVRQDEADTVIDLFAAFDDSTEPDPLLSYSVVGNTNPGLFSATPISVSPAAGTLTLDYAPGRSGTAVLTVRATDTGGLFVDSPFTVNVTPGAPAVASAEFVYQSGAPQRLRFTFNQDVRASLSAADLMVEGLEAGGGPVGVGEPTYDGATNTATFAFGGTGVLPNGNYRATLLAAGVTNAGGTPLAANHVLEFFALAGDINRDRRVDGTDFAILAGNFGRTGRTYEQGDLNGDGRVDGSDFAVLAGNFGRTVPAPPAAAVTAAPAAVPPTTAAAPRPKRPAAAPSRRLPPPRPSRISPRLRIASP